jgi:phage terminase large subunit-like protein
MSNELKLRLPKLHPAQQQIVKESRRFNICCLGRRAGKTLLGQDRLIRPALAGKPTAWFAPTYRLLSEAWREFQTKLYPVTRAINQSEHRLELVGGGVIECWSLDSVDAGRGRAFASVALDECAIIPNLEAAWQENIRPMLTDYRGSAWFLSTPKGTANYFHALYQKGQGVLTGDWKSWQMPTSCNPFIDPTEIVVAREDLSDLAYSQEYEAAFITWAGAVFRRITDAVSTSPMTGRATCIGVDWGRTNDFTVFTVVSDAGEVLAIDRFKGVAYPLQQERLKALWERFGRPAIYAETNAMGQPVIDQLNKDQVKVEGFRTTNASKTQAIEALALAFERGEIRIPNDPVLIGELQAFEAKPLPSGLMRYSHPEGGHDDTVLSLAIAWQSIVEGRRPPKFDPRFMVEIAQANRELGGMAALKAGEVGVYGLGDDLTFSANGDPWAKKWSM